MAQVNNDSQMLTRRSNPLVGFWHGLVGFFKTLRRNRAGFIGFLGLAFYFVLTVIGPYFVAFDDEVNLDEIAGPTGSRIQLMVREEDVSTYTSFESLAGERVGVVEQTGGPSLIAPYADMLEVETYRWSSARTGPGIEAALSDLAAGEIEAMLIFSKTVDNVVFIPETSEGRLLIMDELTLVHLNSLERMSRRQIRQSAEKLAELSTGLALFAEDLAQLSEADRQPLDPDAIVQLAADLAQLGENVGQLEAEDLEDLSLADLTHLDSGVVPQFAEDFAQLEPDALVQLDLEVLAQLGLEDLAQRIEFSNLAVSNPQLGPPHLLGTDTQGRDIATHIVHGGAELIAVAVLAGLIAATIAVVFGSLAALFGGVLDLFLTSLTNLILAIPRFPLLIVLAGLISLDSPFLLAPLIGVLAWPSLMRAIRAQVLSLRERDYVEAAVALDLGTRHIMLREILPNMISYVVINLIFLITFAMYEQIGLVILGLAPINNYTWGVMLFFGRSRGTMFNPDGASMALSPVIAIALFQVFLVMFARALEEMFDPRLRAA